MREAHEGQPYRRLDIVFRFSKSAPTSPSPGGRHGKEFLGVRWLFSAAITRPAVIHSPTALARLLPPRKPRNHRTAPLSCSI